MLLPKTYARTPRRNFRQMCVAFALKDLSLFPASYSAPQINGIALDNKSVTECEALLRSCRDSLSLSLMKVCHTLDLISFTYAKILRKFIPLFHADKLC